jgi:hypothetical protein
MRRFTGLSSREEWNEKVHHDPQKIVNELLEGYVTVNADLVSGKGVFRNSPCTRRISG